MAIDYFEYELKNVITYSDKGNPNCKTSTLFLKAPTMKNIQYISKLEQLQLQSTLSASKIIMNQANLINEDAKKEARERIGEETLEDKRTQIEMMIKLGNIDYMEYHNVFMEFLTHGKNCTLDEDHRVSINMDMIEEYISIEDFKKMMIDYMVNFIKPLAF